MRRGRVVGALSVAAVAIGSLVHCPLSTSSSGAEPPATLARPVQGFGAASTGGAGRPECVVTSLEDSGPRTLRECLEGGHRTVTFAVAGTIRLTSQLSVGSFVTVDGRTAPPPGITLHGFGLNIRNHHDVIIRALRIRNAGGGFSGKASTDCIGMHGPETYNVVIDHVSIHNCADGGIDISSGPRNITIQWSIVSTPKAMLWGSTSSSDSRTTDRISMHHTALICGRWPAIDGVPVGCDRFPLIRASGHALTADVRHNIFAGWLRANGTKIEPAAEVNVVGNAYVPAPASTLQQRQASIAVNPGTQVHTAGNAELGAPPRPNLNENGNRSHPVAAPTITEHELGCVARDAGVHPRDAVDRMLLAFIGPVPDTCRTPRHQASSPRGGSGPQDGRAVAPAHRTTNRLDSGQEVTL